MPQIRSAKKRVEVAERNRKRNKTVKSAIRTSIKDVHTAIADGAEQDKINELVKVVYSRIDTAVLKGIVHKKKGSRDKSRVMAAIKRAS